MKCKPKLQKVEYSTDRMQKTKSKTFIFISCKFTLHKIKIADDLRKNVQN